MLNLTKEEKVLLDIVKAGVSGHTIKIEGTEINWDKVVEESKIQSVVMLACDSAVATKEIIPAETFDRWQKLAVKGMMHNIRVQRAQNSMCSIMEKASQRCVILKGLAAAYYYPKPELRSLGDVDFLIDPDKKDDLITVFVENGYTTYLENHDCHVVLKKNGEHLEMHIEPSGIPNGQTGDYIRKIFENTLNEGVLVNCCGSMFCTPAPVHHGMILALHMRHHQVAEGLGLRHLCDWACFVKKTAEDDFWTVLNKEFESIGLMKYVALITKTCALYLGIKLPEWARSADDMVCEEIINDIFEAGNFGRKDAVRSTSGMMVSNHGKDGTGYSKLFYLYDTLHKSSAQAKPELKDKPFLWFIEDCRRTALYLIKVARGERFSIFKMIPVADKRKNVYKEFHLFETE